MLDSVLLTDCSCAVWKLDLGECKFGGVETCGNTVVAWARVVMVGRGCDLRFIWEVRLARVWSLIGC